MGAADTTNINDALGEDFTRASDGRLHQRSRERGGKPADGRRLARLLRWEQHRSSNRFQHLGDADDVLRTIDVGRKAADR